MKRITLICLIFCMLLFSGCSTVDKETAKAENRAETLIIKTARGNEYERFIDRQAGVVCYVAYRSSIFCLPIEQTLLPKG